MRTEPLFVLTAAILHAVPLAVARLAAPEAVVDASWTQEVRTIEVETLPEEIPPEPTEERETPPAPTEERETPPEQRPVTHGGAIVPSAPEVAPNGQPVEPPPAPAPLPSSSALPPDEYGPAPPDERAGGPIPGLNGSPIWSMPGMIPSASAAPPAPTTAGKPREVDKDIAGIVLRKELKTKDKNLGLDLPAAGTVASAVGQAVRGSAAPAVARASFEVRLGPGGQVLGVRVAGFNAGASDVWERVAQAVKALLAGRALHMNDAYKKGGTVYVDVSSTLELPSGGPGGLEGAGARFDLSNIGAHAGRVVRTSFRAIAIK